MSGAAGARANMMASPPKRTSSISTVNCPIRIASFRSAGFGAFADLGLNRQLYWHVANAFLGMPKAQLV